jgi:MFS superfamily sulfate permease-like transporter
MQKKTRSLLEELEIVGNNRDTTHIIESRAHNIITSAINLLELINKHYDTEKAAVLERKLLNAIKSRDQDRFSRSIRKSDEV